MVCNIKISITRRKALPFAFDAWWHGKFDNVQGTPITEGHFLEKLTVFLKRKMVGVTLVLLDNSNDGSFGYKSCDIINVAIGIISFNSIPEPNDLVNAKVML